MCNSTDEWINKTCIHQQMNVWTTWSIHTMKYSAIKRNKALTQATTWKNLENILSERSQAQKAHILWFHLYEMSRIGTSMETESRFVVAKGWRQEEMEGQLTGMVSFLGDENVLELVVVAAQLCEYTKKPWMVHF